MNCGLIEVIKYVPTRIKNIFLNADVKTINAISEIRLKSFCPLLILYDGKLKSISVTSSVVEPENGCFVYGEDVEYTYGMIIKDSVYAYGDEIPNGFITVDGGHRAGISGTAVMKNGEVVGMKDINGIYFRIAGEYYGCAKSVIDLIYHKGVVLNSIIAAPPGKGKTTVLRELARILSGLGMKVSIVDERHEISAQSGGISAFDLSYCDVLNGFPKAKGIENAVRTLSPDVVIFDEIGSVKEAESIASALNCGVKFITSAHASSLNELLSRPIIKFLTDMNAVDSVVLYEFGVVKEFKYLKGMIYGKEHCFELDIRSVYGDGSCEKK